MSDREKDGVFMTPGNIVAGAMSVALPVLFVIAALVAIGRAFGWIG